MRILILSNSNSEHTQKWAINLAQRGFEIGIFSFKKCETDIFKDHDNISLLYEPSEQKGHLSILHKFNYLFLLRKLKKAISDFKPDILHAHYASSYGLLGALSGFKNFVVSAWGSDILEFPKKNFVFENIIRFVLKKAKCITVTSDYLQREITEFTNKPVKVIPFGIDTSIFKPSYREHKEFTFCSTKHLESMYNIDVVIKAFELLAAVHPHVRLKIAGNGTQANELMQLCSTNDLQTKIEFLGRIPNSEMPSLLNSSDVLINIPAKESFGVSVIEAMACEKGIIVSNIAAFETLIVDKKNGFKIDPVKVETLFIAMEKYVLQRDLLNVHGKNNRAKVEKEFDLNSAIYQMSCLYKEFDNVQPLPIPSVEILKRTA